MDGFDLLRVRKQCSLNQEEACRIAGITNLGYLTEVERGIELSDTEFERLTTAWSEFVTQRENRKKENRKREEVMV